MKKKNYRQDIQILRGVSILLVVFYHLRIPGFKNGFVGVDIFFVISGYLMAQLYYPDRKFDFFIRRAKRLMPAYLSTIFLTILIGFLTLIPSDFKQLLDQTKASLFLIPNLYFWSQDSYFTGTQFNPLLNLWSLGVEFQFYLILLQ
jgi:peptidoglycan/LPS O-acetylase OafA/YrhL